MTNETFKVGDIVYLVDMDQADTEAMNWIKDTNMKIGDKAIVSDIGKTKVQWIELEGIDYWHPSCKFSKTKP